MKKIVLICLILIPVNFAFSYGVPPIQRHSNLKRSISSWHHPFKKWMYWVSIEKFDVEFTCFDRDEETVPSCVCRGPKSEDIPKGSPDENNYEFKEFSYYQEKDTYASIKARALDTCLPYEVGTPFQVMVE